MNYKHQNREVPADTAKLAHKIYRKRGNRLLKLRDELGIIYRNDEFADLFSHRGRRAEAPGNLVLILILQYMEGLSDEGAAEQVRSRVDWKYVLGLSLDDEGFDGSVLCRFRQRLLAGSKEEALLRHLLEHIQAKGWLNQEQQRTDSSYILGAGRRLNRLELVGETMRMVLEKLAELAPQWLGSWLPGEWVAKYELRFEAYHLPQKRAEQEALAVEIGQDGVRLWQQLQAAEFEGLRRLGVVEILRQIWMQQYTYDHGQLRWRTHRELPPASQQICSPHEVEMRYSYKRGTEWTGYKVHITETYGDRKTPHLITDVTTTPATVPDVKVTADIQQKLADRDVKPDRHTVDQGYMAADHVATSQENAIHLLGPVSADSSWQASLPDGFTVDQFQIDWSQQVVTCPAGACSTTWSSCTDTYGKKIIHVRFPRRACQPCPDKHRCTRAEKNGRSLKLKPYREHTALRQARAYQQTEAFTEQYRKRAGVEGAISQAVHHLDGRRSRYSGLSKTHLHNLLTALAINLTRVGRWLLGAPRARTRRSPLRAVPLLT